MIEVTEMKDIHQLRKQLKVVNHENKTLKQQLSAKEESVERYVKKLQSADEDERLAQHFLHSYLGAEMTMKNNTIEVCFKPFCSGIPQGQYFMVLETLGETTWQVVGYNLPLSIPNQQGMNIQSREQLGEIIREVTRDIQAYAERKYQVARTEEILKNVTNASIWYTTMLRTVFLSLPITIPGSGDKTLCEVELNYDVSHTLPFRITTKAKGIDAVRLAVLRKRMENFLKHFSLITVMKAEFENDSEEEGTLSSILGNL